jgi:hypothetical protein
MGRAKPRERVELRELTSVTRIRRRLEALGCTPQQVQRHMDRGRRPSDWCAHKDARLRGHGRPLRFNRWGQRRRGR